MDENEVAARLLAEHGGAVEAAGEPRWLQVRVDSAGRLRSVVRREPAGWVGQLLPAGWEAVAIVATGRVHAVDPAHEMPASVAPARQGGLRLCCVVTRSGRVGWKAQLPPAAAIPTSATPAAADHPLARAPEEGLMLDVLRRAVGRPTPPPSVPAGDLLTLIWVEMLTDLREARDSSRLRPAWRATWSDLIGVHPTLPLGPATDPDEAESILTAVGSWATWDEFRRTAVTDAPRYLLPGTDLAGWMDDGIFSRWVMERLPTARTAVMLAKTYLDPDGYRRLHRLSRAIGQSLDRTYVR